MKRKLSVGFVLVGLVLLGVATIAGERVRYLDGAKQQANPSSEIPNPQIDPQAFLDATEAAMKLRQSRRLTETEFLKMSQEQDVVVLDARSRNRYEELHIQGAISLPFTDFTFDNFAQRLPDKNVKILIYCNNNFRGNVPEFPSKSFGSALNLSSFTSLYEYGYRNVYELGPELDLETTRLMLVGTAAEKYVTTGK